MPYWSQESATQSEREAVWHDLHEVTNDYIVYLEITYPWHSRVEPIRTFRDGRCGNVINGSAQPRVGSATEIPHSDSRDRRECNSNISRGVSQFRSVHSGPGTQAL